MTAGADVDSPGPLHTTQTVWFSVTEPSSCAAVRRRAAEVARSNGLDEDRIGEVSIAAAELASNLVKHAVDGWMALRPLARDGGSGIGLLSIDRGPGTRDIHALVEDGVTTTGTLGIGLGAVARLADVLDLHSVPGIGTVVSAEFHPAPSESSGAEDASGFAGLTRPLAGEDVCGDAYGEREVPGGRLVLMADGLGHGPLAARASAAAVRVFLRSRRDGPAELLDELHRALQDTRGAAIAVARHDAAAGTLHYAGVGNISGRVVDMSASSQLPSQPGIVGHNSPTVREVTVPLQRGQWLVMHSDGLTDRWRMADLPGVMGSGPVVLAAAVLRAAGTRRDDAGVLALRPGRLGQAGRSRGAGT